VVRSRKRKATQPEDGRRDRSRVSVRQGGATQVRVSDRRAHEDLGEGNRYRSRSRQGYSNSDGRDSKNVRVCYIPSVKNDSAEEKKVGYAHMRLHLVVSVIPHFLTQF